MSLLHEKWLWTLTTPLFAAVARKKKIAKKAVRRKTAKPARARVRKSARAKKPARRVIPKATGKRAAHAKPEMRPSKVKRERIKLPLQPAVAKPVPAEALPKPVPLTGRAILLLPENEKFADSVHPTFRWLSVGGATRYEVAWSEDANFAQSHSIISIATEATVPVEKPLRVGALYHWHVRGGNESGWGPWSSGASFRALGETA